MGIEITVKDNNVDQIINEMKALKIVALKAVGMQAVTYAQLYCPVGTPESTGKKGYQGGTLRGSIDSAVDEDTVYIGTNIEYAPYVELGTRKMRPRHYLKKACENHIDEYKNIIEAQMSD